MERYESAQRGVPVKLLSYSLHIEAPLNVEEVVSVSHHVACSNGVCAPPGWNLEHPARPYPTELQMGLSHLAQAGDTPMQTGPS